MNLTDRSAVTMSVYHAVAVQQEIKQTLQVQLKTSVLYNIKLTSILIGSSEKLYILYNFQW